MTLLLNIDSIEEGWRVQTTDCFYPRPPFRSLAFCTSQLKFSVGNIWTKRGPDLRGDLMAVLFFTRPQPKSLHERTVNSSVSLFLGRHFCQFFANIFLAKFSTLFLKDGHHHQLYGRDQFCIDVVFISNMMVPCPGWRESLLSWRGRPGREACVKITEQTSKKYTCQSMRNYWSDKQMLNK